MMATMAGVPLYADSGYIEAQPALSAPIDGIQVPLVRMEKRLVRHERIALNQPHRPHAGPALRADDHMVVHRHLHVPPGLDQVAGQADVLLDGVGSPLG